MAEECSALSVQWFVNMSTLNDADTFVILWYQNVCKYFISETLVLANLLA